MTKTLGPNGFKGFMFYTIGKDDTLIFHNVDVIVPYIPSN